MKSERLTTEELHEVLSRAQSIDEQRKSPSAQAVVERSGADISLSYGALNSALAEFGAARRAQERERGRVRFPLSVWDLVVPALVGIACGAALTTAIWWTSEWWREFGVWLPTLVMNSILVGSGAMAAIGRQTGRRTYLARNTALWFGVSVGMYIVSLPIQSVEASGSSLFSMPLMGLCISSLIGATVLTWRNRRESREPVDTTRRPTREDSLWGLIKYVLTRDVFSSQTR